MRNDTVINAREAFEATMRLGEHYEGTTVLLGDTCKVEIHERSCWREYSRRCRYPMIKRWGYVTLAKGWHVTNIGGVLTFYRGKYNRNGMHCLYAVQGRAIADIALKDGYVVKGEHIDAKSLVSAKRINAEHRRSMLEIALRRRVQLEKEIERLEGVIVDYSASIAGGNCRAGTESFIRKVEDKLGREVKELSARDVLKFGRMFGVELFARRAVDCAIARRMQS